MHEGFNIYTPKEVNCKVLLLSERLNIELTEANLLRYCCWKLSEGIWASRREEEDGIEEF